MRGDEEGELTFHEPNVESVVDYIIVNDDVIEETVEFKVEQRTESDHQPLELEFKVETGMSKWIRNNKIVSALKDWTEKGVREYWKKKG